MEAMVSANGTTTVSEQPDRKVSGFSLAFFCAGMVLHCLLDGLAVGVFQDPHEIALIAVSFTLHRIPESFAVGAAFKSNN